MIFYISKDLCFNTRALNCKEVENIIFDILLPKSKPITISIFYRPPNQANFMELLVKSFSLLMTRRITRSLYMMLEIKGDNICRSSSNNSGVFENCPLVWEFPHYEIWLKNLAFTISDLF